MSLLNYTEYEPLGNGSYLCEITGVDEVISDRFTDSKGQPVQQYAFTLELLQPEHAGRTLMCWATATLSNRSKLGKDLAGPLFGHEWLKEHPLDPTLMYGLRVNVLVSEEVKDDGERYDRVTGFRHVPKAFENGSYTIEMAKARIIEQGENANVPEQAAAPSPAPAQTEILSDPVGEPPLTGEQQAVPS